MDDIDHVLKYLREEYRYQVWALVGHSRGDYQVPFNIDFRCKCCIPLRYYARSIYTTDCKLLGEVHV
jgi:hypothetical protein